ncbi:MAG: hypothetical protein II964_00960 [Synergistaceae bacterium]|nr:hypothetical protein [Synergistaceae bacterium]
MKERKILRGLNTFAEGIAEKIADFIIKDDYEEIVTLNFCIQLVKRERTKNPEAKYFTLTAEENEEPSNENDNFIIRIIMKDKNKEDLPGGYILHAGKIDDDMTELLNGRESVTIKMEE